MSSYKLSKISWQLRSETAVFKLSIGSCITNNEHFWINPKTRHKMLLLWQKLRWMKFFYRIFLMKMVKYPQTYPLIPKIPLGWSIKSKFWRIFKYTFIHVKYVVQRFVPRDLIFWSFAYCLTISESSCQYGSDGTQIWASNSMVSS